MAPLTCVSSILRRQFGVIRLDQLAAADFSYEAVRHLVRTERLSRRFAGVYIAEGFVDCPQQRALAAVFACGEGSALSRISAAVHWRLLRFWPLMPQVTKRGTSGAKGPRGVDLRHANALEIVRHDGIPITTIPRTLHDIAQTLQPHVLKAAVRQAEIQHGLDLTTIEARGALRRFLTDYVSVLGVENDFEADFLELCHRHDVPRPLTQYHAGDYRADFAWPEHRVIVETDGRGSREGFVAFRDQRVRMRFLQSQGWEVLQFTYEEVKNEPAKVAAEVRSALSRRRPGSRHS